MKINIAKEFVVLISISSVIQASLHLGEGRDRFASDVAGCVANNGKG
jgi:hypothetical protein